MLGPGYTWNDFFAENVGKNALKVAYDSPSTAYMVMWMFFDCIFYFLLAWYFDNVVSSNRGKDESKTFFLNKDYWVTKPKTKIINASQIG